MCSSSRGELTIISLELKGLNNRFVLFRGAFILVPIAHVMRQRAARREEESSNFTSSETHSRDSPQGRHYFGWLDYKMCSLISCQGCPKNTSLDLCLTRECKLDLKL